MIRLAVIGDPVSHSASPDIAKWLAERCACEVRAEALHVPEGALADTLDRLRAGDWDGLAVTLPHKERALALADGCDAEAEAVGATNCLVREPPGRVLAHNTDVAGVVGALAEHGVGFEGRRVLLLGAGGAARAAARAARAGGAARLRIANRTSERAAVLADAFEGEPVEWISGALRAALGDSDLLIQATSVGLDAPGRNPLPDGCVLHPELTVLDMVYRPRRTALLAATDAAGGRAVDGLWMLVHQALVQWRLWTGRALPPGTAASLHAHLAGRE